MAVEARPALVAIDATSMIVVKTSPNRVVYWSLLGNGSLQPLSTVTDANGAAAAVLTPTGAAGDQITVSVTYGT